MSTESLVLEISLLWTLELLLLLLLGEPLAIETVQLEGAEDCGLVYGWED